MQLLEVLLFILIVAMGFSMMGRRPMRAPHRAVLLSFAVILFTLHIVLGGARWQLYPLYAALGVSGIHAYLGFILRTPLKKRTGKILVIASSLFAFVSLASALVFPLYELPAPGGEHPVGTESFMLEDGERTEAYGDDPGGNRRFKVQA